MITSLYQSLCNMETNIADRVALRWYDEKKQGVAEVHYAQYAQDLRTVRGVPARRVWRCARRACGDPARNSYQYVIDVRHGSCRSRGCAAEPWQGLGCYLL